MNLEDAIFKTLQANLVHAGRFFKQFTLKTYQYRFTAEDKYRKEADEHLSQTLKHIAIVEQMYHAFEGFSEPGGLSVKLLADYPEEAYWYEQAAAYVNSRQQLSEQPLPSN